MKRTAIAVGIVLAFATGAVAQYAYPYSPPWAEYIFQGYLSQPIPCGSTENLHSASLATTHVDQNTEIGRILYICRDGQQWIREYGLFGPKAPPPPLSDPLPSAPADLMPTVVCAPGAVQVSPGRCMPVRQ